MAALLKGDNSEAAFAALVRQHATSGVSGVEPKFLDAQADAGAAPAGTMKALALHKKASVITRRHIIKGSSARLPFVAQNEHLCMQVARRVLPTAQTEVSDDGQALVLHRFDVDEHGQPLWGMEGFAACWACAPPPSTTPPGNASPRPCATMCPARSGLKLFVSWPPPCC